MCRVLLINHKDVENVINKYKSSFDDEYYRAVWSLMRHHRKKKHDICSQFATAVGSSRVLKRSVQKISNRNNLIENGFVAHLFA